MSLSLLIKPASGHCNMRCKYCFYIDETNHREHPYLGMMSVSTLDVLIDKIIASPYRNISILFQGGEPTLVGLDFYIHLSEKLSQAPSDFVFHLAFQTNGLTLNRDWAKWFFENKVLVGISLDGPAYLHDKYRVDVSGEKTFDTIMENITLLQKEHVDFNVLSVITKDSAKKAKKFTVFSSKECLAPMEDNGANYLLTPKNYSGFMRDLFDEWYKDRKSLEPVYNRYFENLLLIAAGRQPEACNMQGRCSTQWAIEADGSVYPCDFYVLDQWKLGNIHKDDFDAMNQTRKALGFIEASLAIPEKCSNCSFYKYCRNGCMRLRSVFQGEPVPTNIFCEGLKEFLPYAIPKLEKLLRTLYP